MVEDTGCDGIELNFGCPHGMSERGMGAAVGQVPEYIEMVTRWCKQYSKLPVIVKLTPNITDIRHPARAAKKGGADAVSLINTINSIMGVDLDTMTMSPSTGGKGIARRLLRPGGQADRAQHGGRDRARSETAGLPISGIGGISNWRDAAEYIALGCGTVQVCTAAMVYGFKIVQDMISGLSNFMDEKGYTQHRRLPGSAVPTVTDWRTSTSTTSSKAVINQDSASSAAAATSPAKTPRTRPSRRQRTANATSRSRKRSAWAATCASRSARCPNCITMRSLKPGEVDRQDRTGEYER
jgi:dihydropyrimidine dehydrogenase (NAD+) subunit PreA